MNDDLSLNLEAVEPVAKHLVKNHVNGVFVCGTTGESMLLSVDERKAVILLLGIDVQLAEKWIEVGHRYGLCVIIHIGHEVLSVAQDLAKHSYVGFFTFIFYSLQEKGADAVALVPPRFFPPRSLDLLVQWVADVASVIPSLPVFYYHLDVINYTPYPINRFLELASTRIPNLCGMKFTDYNSLVMGLCLDACDGKFTVLMGREDVCLVEMIIIVQAMLASLATGCCGFVGSTFSIMGKVFDRLLNAYAAGDMKTARLEMERARNYSKIMYQSGNRYGEGIDSITLIKTCWEFLGIDNGPCRLLG